MPDRGALLIADITGYSGFLNASELEHAQGSLAALIELLVTHTRPPLAISRLEGDAVISYAIDGSLVQGEVLVDMIEETYVAFRRALESMVLNTNCTCNACRNISNLDLKFFVHHGEFMRPAMGGHEELMGRDVNLVFRLTKNSITTTTGIRAYTAYTHQAVDALGIAAFAETLTAHRDTYPDVGEIEVFVQDMAPVWQRRREQVRQRVKPEDSVLTLGFDTPIPPALTWDYLSNPHYRAILTAVDSTIVDQRQRGRIGEGSVYVCAHGKATLRHTVVDWHPFETMTFLGPGGLPRTQQFTTIDLTPIATGTHVAVHFSKSLGPVLLRSLNNFGLKTMIKRVLTKSGGAFVAAIQRDIDADTVAQAEASIAPDAEAIWAAASESLGTDRPAS